MTGTQSWLDVNEQFLARRFQVLARRLESAVAGQHVPLQDPAHNREFENLEAGTSRPALIELAERLGLSPFEEELLLLCAAIELQPSISELVSRLQPAARSLPSFALAMTILDDAAWDVLSPERPLRRFRLIEIHQPPHTALTQAGLKADERIVNYIKGLNSLDERLRPLLHEIEPGRDDLPLCDSQGECIDELCREILLTAPDQQTPLLQLLGTDGPSKLSVARGVASRFGRQLLRLPLDLLPSDLRDIDSLIWLWEREARLSPIALFVEQPPVLSDDRQSVLADRFLSRAGGLVFVAADEPRTTAGRRTFNIDIAKPTVAEQQALWHASVPWLTTSDVERLVGQFSFDSESLVELARRAATGESSFSSLWTSCRRQARPRLDCLARRSVAKATWRDLVLPAPELSLLREVVSHVACRTRVYGDWGFGDRHQRGLGVSVLFAGESGTGKTMAAEVLANALDLDLYRVDLSHIVSKYIGETEKNLRRVFDAADDGGVVLFFDEADALFGKRTEVKDSHDRYANIEVNYLLQRMEAYRGVAILATNLKKSLDAAFLRRLRFVIYFPVPSSDQQFAIWQRAFPAATPLSDLDYAHLARLGLTGGNIHTVAMNAALSSAATEGVVTMPHILNAARSELRKLQKPINDADFRWNERKETR